MPTRTAPWPVTCLITLASLAAGPGRAQHSPIISPDPQSFGRFGWSVAAAGDLDSDGTPDFVVGAYQEAGGGVENSGRAHLVSGAGGSSTRTLESPDPEEDGWFGWSVAAAGDSDGDGVPDVLVGAPGERVGDSVGSGRAYVFSGADGAVIRRLVSPGATADGAFGWSVAAAGDIDGDGTADVAVGAPSDDEKGIRSGRVYVFSGADGTLLRTLASPHSEAGGTFGGSIAVAGGASGDGVPGLLVGARGEAGGGVAGSGRAYLFSGADGTLVHTLESPNPEVDGLFGSSVVSPGDLTGDGTPDLVIGATVESAGGLFRSGRAYAFSGSDAALLHTFESPNREPDGLFGWGVAAAGDVSGDGMADVAVAAPFETGGGFSFAGRVYVFSAASDSLLHTLESTHAEQLGLFGQSLAPAGDLDGDGVPDLLVGASDEDVADLFDSGRVHVLSGRTGTVVPVEPPPLPPRADGLSAPFPNPFAEQTQLRLHVAQPQHVHVAAYDVMGRLTVCLHDGLLPAGEHRFTLHGAGLPSGVYYVRAVGASLGATRRVVLVR